MRMIARFWAALFFLSASFWVMPACAGEGNVADLERKVEALSEEIERIKLGGAAEPKYESYSGLGPAASKIYGIDKGFSFGGYGEIVYSDFKNTKKDFADVYRFILYAGYKFHDMIIMNTELEYEHAGIKNTGDKKPEVYVEFSYLDFHISEPFKLRAGLMLMPIGIRNELHEPTVYYGVYRPEIETNIIPSTWRDIGVMAYGDLGSLAYKIALVNGLRSDTFKKETWIRGGRQQGAEVNANETAWIGSLSYRVSPAILFGGAYYMGGADDYSTAGANRQGTVNLWEAHADFNHAGLEMRALYAKGAVDGNAALKAANSIGREAAGWYAEAAYDILPLVHADSGVSLAPFVRYEEYDTNKKVFSGTPDKTLDRIVTTAGLSFKPHQNVVVKADYQWRDTASSLPAGKGAGHDENKIDQFNLGIGFIF